MSTESAVDAQSPWLGLASFTEETRAFFFGREEEVAELARRVQRKLLTVLFGQSGLGKTSILRAGLVPRLRGQGYCPVYVRIDYGADAPAPSDQIKRAIAQTARRSGEWTQAGVAVQGESLWEFLHHRDDVLRDESGTTLIPLLIFDQFEEIFTLAQSDDAGRARAARFIADLADLVENRPPRELEAKLDTDEAAAEKFDFARSDYRVLIALREDYLAPLEGLKGAMPSVAQNRLRLAPMTGRQALAAVLQPGKGLVSEEVAAAIVRFVAGGAEIANAEVEPSLLSLICRELNDARLAQGRREISLDLLDGSQSSILSNFYERALADQPAAVRRVIEDQLLTASGFRENIAEERLLASFKAAGAAPETLALLVNRRLLRIEERLDVRRVELTHDVLCGVVKSSRDLRQEREAREATDRLLEEQRGRETAARKSLARARQVAAVCASLAILAIAAAGFAVVSTQRARRAEAAAQETRSAADQARGQAEHLLSYLTDDFARELESFGRLDAVAEIAKRQIDYFAALPAALKGKDSILNAALAMVSYARAARLLGDIDDAGTASAEAVRLATNLQQGGDASEATKIALARAYEVQSAVLSNTADAKTLPTIKHAAQVLEPIAMAPGASVAVRRAYVGILTTLGFEQSHTPEEFDQAHSALQRAQSISADLGGRDLKNLEAAVMYAEAGAWQVEVLQKLGRIDEARAVGIDAAAVAAKVLEVRPSYRSALHANQLIQGDLGGLAQDDLRPAEAIAYNLRSIDISHVQIKLDPNNTVAWNNLSIAYLTLGDVAWSQGRVRESVDYYHQALDAVGRASHAGAWFVLNALYPTGILALRQADAGMPEAAQKTQEGAVAASANLHSTEPGSSQLPIFADCYVKFVQAGLALARDDPQSARRAAQDSARAVRDRVPSGGFQGFFKEQCTFNAVDEQGQAEYLMADYAAAERTLRAALDARKEYPDSSNSDHRDVAGTSTLLALAMARQGRLSDAAQIVDPVVKLHRTLAAHNHGDGLQTVELAKALYVQAMCESDKRVAALREAAALMDGLPAGLRPLHSVRLWRNWIGEAQKR